MQYLLRPENAPKVLFSVLDDGGSLVYQVIGEVTPLACNFVLRTPDGAAAARVIGACLPNSFRCTAAAGPRRIQFSLRVGGAAASRQPVRFHGVRWRFRGSLVGRSFDVVEEQPGVPSRVVMTHGRCWGSAGDCFAVSVQKPADARLALCFAAAADLSSQCICPQPVPAG